MSIIEEVQWSIIDLAMWLRIFLILLYTENGVLVILWMMQRFFDILHCSGCSWRRQKVIRRQEVDNVSSVIRLLNTQPNAQLNDQEISIAHINKALNNSLDSPA